MGAPGLSRVVATGVRVGEEAELGAGVTIGDGVTAGGKDGEWGEKVVTQTCGDPHHKVGGVVDGAEEAAGVVTGDSTGTWVTTGGEPPTTRNNGERGAGVAPGDCPVTVEVAVGE